MGYDFVTLEHFVSVAIRSVLKESKVGLAFTLVVPLLGLIQGFLAIWLDQRFRPSKLRPAIVWQAAVFGSRVLDFFEKISPRNSGIPSTKSDCQSDRRGLVCLIPGTWSGHARYDWSRWTNIEQLFSRDKFVVERVVWSGGNSASARHNVAQRLSKRIKYYCECHPNGTVTLIGHSHGGSIAYLTARMVKVDALISLATPFIEFDSSIDDVLKTDLDRGIFVRFASPLFVAGIGLWLWMLTWEWIEVNWALSFLAVMTLSGSLILTIVATLVIPTYAERKLVKGILTQPLIGIPHELVIRFSKGDEILTEMLNLEDKTKAIADCLRSTQLVERPAASTISPTFFTSPLRPLTVSPELIALGPIVKGGAKEVVKFALFAGTIDFFFSVLFASGVLGPDASNFIWQWLTAMSAWSLLTYGLHLAYMGLLYTGFRRLLEGRYLSPYHGATHRSGQYHALVARLSQVYQSKARLLGLSHFGLHLYSARIKSLPSQGNARVEDIHAQTNKAINLHSAILTDRQAISAIEEWTKVSTR
jgi:hypothetical protein